MIGDRRAFFDPAVAVGGLNCTEETGMVGQLFLSLELIFQQSLDLLLILPELVACFSMSLFF